MAKASLKFFIVGILTIMAAIPLAFIAYTVAERADYSDEAYEDVSKSWGAPQELGTPVLSVPFYQINRIEKTDATTRRQ